MNKKIISTLVLLICLVLTFAIVGCDGTVNVVAKKGPFNVVSNGTTVELGAKADDALDKLGEANAVQSAGNCGGLGETTLYFYDGFNIAVVDYEDGDAVIDKINITDDRVETSEGIYIGSDKDDVIEAYGEPTESKVGALIYKTGNRETVFGVLNNKVATITMRVVG